MFLEHTFSALSDANRRKVIDMLKKKDMTVSEMLAGLDITMPTLSHHLDILKRADLVSSHRDGQNIIYSLNLSIIEETSEAIVKLLAVRR
jgi:ArsR family transcriptional regulator, arsenate/arsenite/antimonite-responsive transcriptional repressor